MNQKESTFMSSRVRRRKDTNSSKEKGVVDDGRLLGEAGYSFLLPSLSSSLMVSNTFDVGRLMTLIICGGATSVTNLAIREFAITFEG